MDQDQNNSDYNKTTFGWKNDEYDYYNDYHVDTDQYNDYYNDYAQQDYYNTPQNDSVSSTSTSSSDDEDRLGEVQSEERANDDAEESYATVLYHAVQDAISEARAKGQTEVQSSSCDRCSVASVIGVVSTCIVATAVTVASSPSAQAHILALVEYAGSWF